MCIYGLLVRLEPLKHKLPKLNEYIFFNSLDQKKNYHWFVILIFFSRIQKYSFDINALPLETFGSFQSFRVPLIISSSLSFLSFFSSKTNLFPIVFISVCTDFFYVSLDTWVWCNLMGQDYDEKCLFFYFSPTFALLNCISHNRSFIQLYFHMRFLSSQGFTFT